MDASHGKMDPREYMSQHGIQTYVRDLLEMLTAHLGDWSTGESEDDSRKRLAFAAMYFEQLATGNHILQRMYAFVCSTDFNVSAFIIQFRTMLGHMLHNLDAVRTTATVNGANGDDDAGRSEPRLSRELCLSVARLIVPDFPRMSVDLAWSVMMQSGASGTGDCGQGGAIHDDEAALKGDGRGQLRTRDGTVDGRLDAFVDGLDAVMRDDDFASRCMEQARSSGSLLSRILIEEATIFLGMDAKEAKETVDWAHARSPAASISEDAERAVSGASHDGDRGQKVSVVGAHGRSHDIDILASFLLCKMQRSKSRRQSSDEGKIERLTDPGFVSRLIERNARRAHCER